MFLEHRWCCLQAASSVHYTTSCKHSLVLLRMDEIIARNMLSWLWLLINTITVASSWLFTLLYPGYKFTLRVSEIHFNYKLPLKLTPPKWSFPSIFTYQNFVRIFVSLSNVTFASQLILLGLISLTLQGTNTHKTSHYSIFLDPNSLPSSLIALSTSKLWVIIYTFIYI